MSDTGAGVVEPWPLVDLHLEWGPLGARLAAERGDLVVVVDVLSFTTSATLVASRGATVLSYSGAEIEAAGGREALCAAVDAEIIARTRAVEAGGYSLSPASLATIEPGVRLILTSLNGAAATTAATAAPAVALATLANRSAVASWVANSLAAGLADRCTLVPCGEHWSSVLADGEGWRPCLEDHLGAGAVASALVDGPLTLSPEALAAAVLFATADDMAAAVTGSVSGRELVDRGFADDVAIATAVDTTSTVPVWLPTATGPRTFVPQ